MKALRILVVVCTFFVAVSHSQTIAAPTIPPKFKLDFDTAAKLHPEILTHSEEPGPTQQTGKIVFQKLIAATSAASRQFHWELRILNRDDLNAFSSPDGMVLVDKSLAKLVGDSPGLWAAILSHEIAHVVRRDWARRYLFQKSLESRGGAEIVLGDPGIPGAQWTNSETASAELAKFCRQLEIEADQDALKLMALAGFHPDFVPALHHLLHAQGTASTTPSLYSMHPCWEERDVDLMNDYRTASVEFARRWREWYSSPGGNPPIVVFAESPKLRRKKPSGWEIQIEMHCRNLSGTVEVVMHSTQSGGGPNEERQLTGCTSSRTLLTFSVSSDRTHATEFEVLDAWGKVLTRTEY